MAIVKALVPVAWADGVFDAKEKEMLEALLDAFQASDDEKKEMRDYAAQKKSIDDINLQELSADDRRLLLQHAVFLTFVDGEQGDT
ncbi:MAG: TerB family tellurite resistance protein, partial [Polyangiaceae bacterium]